MKCIIPGQNVKTLGKAINTLSKIGEELHVEFLAEELMLRAVSPAKSAYGSFTFHPDFFNDFRNESSTRNKQAAHKDAHNRFRFYMKSLLPIFKATNGADQQLESFEIEADINEEKMHFSFLKKCRVVQKHSIRLMETSLLQTAYTKKDMKSHAVASARLLTEIVSHFHNKVMEITLTFQENHFSATNYTADLPDPKQASQMQLIMDMDEFDHYEIERPTALTCTLRELKAIVSFISTLTYSSDVTGMASPPVNLYFTGPSIPLLLYIESPGQYEASFVIATVEAGPGHPLSQQNAQATNNRMSAPDTGNVESTSSRVQLTETSKTSENSKSRTGTSKGRTGTSETPKTSKGRTTTSETSETSQGRTETSATSQSASAVTSFTKGGTFERSSGSTSVTKKLVGLETSRQLTQRPSQMVAKEYLAGDTDEEGSEGEL